MSVEQSWKLSRESDLACRKSLLSQICAEMKKAKPQCTSAELDRLKEAARSIELCLYESASTRSDYLDLNTLQKRIKDVLQNIQKQSTNIATTSNTNTDSATTTSTTATSTPSSSSNDENTQSQSTETKAEDKTSSQKSSEAQCHGDDRAAGDINSGDLVINIRRRRLIKIFHASKCKAKDCTWPDCAKNRALFEHVITCPLETCPVEKCVSTRYLLVHFRVCTDAQCPVCKPVKDIMSAGRKRKRASTAAAVVDSEPFIGPLSLKRPRVKTENKKSEEKPIDLRFVRSCVSGTGPNFLSHLSSTMISQHISSLKVEKLQPLVFPVLRKLMEHKHNRDIFNLPVDAIALNIPHYHKMITEPMDLGTVRQKIEDGCYSEFSQFDADVQLVFSNAMKFNPPQHPVHLLAGSFLKLYTTEVGKIRAKLNTFFKSNSKQIANTAQSKCNLCFQKSCEVCPLCDRGCIGYEPRVIYCSSNCTTRIQRNVYYYCTPAHSYCFCTDCVEKQRKRPFVEVQGGSRIMKVDLVKKKNSNVASEPWVSCDRCEKWHHQICALYNPRKDDPAKRSSSSYLCPTCVLNDREAGAETNSALPPTASDLKSCELSAFIEEWVRHKHEKNQERERQMSHRISRDPGPPPSSLKVRMIHNHSEVCKVKNFASKCFDKVPTRLQYMSKCLLLFQELDGVDTLIFVMFVQEFGENNGEQVKEEGRTENPNERQVYIAYLDSVHYLRPRRFRTDIYHTFLLGYLEYTRRRGFVNAYIWACPPPNKRDDYILHCHPEDQRVPNSERLRQWYNSMALKGVEVGIVASTCSLHAEHFPRVKEVTTENKVRKSKQKALEDISLVSNRGNKSQGKKLGKTIEQSNSVDECSEGGTVEELEEQVRSRLALDQRIPYFDGDYWPQELEEIAKDEEMKRRKTPDSESLISLSPDIMREVLLKRLSEQLNAMKHDFLVIKLAHHCTECGESVLWKRYECRHESCLLSAKDGEWDRRSKFVLCEACLSKELEKPVAERHGRMAPDEASNICGDGISGAVLQSSRKKVALISETEHLFVCVEEPIPETTKDSNPIMMNEFMQNRHAFLALCSGNKYQFNQLRRAKASTLMVLYHLHNPLAPANLFTCTKCQKDILSKHRYHCAVCSDFDLCESCHQCTQHEHPLHVFFVTRGLTLNTTEAERSSADSRRARVQSIQLFCHFLLHASSCSGKKDCKLDFCKKIKGIIAHSKNCEHNNDVAKCTPCRDYYLLLRLCRTQKEANSLSSVKFRNCAGLSESETSIGPWSDLVSS